MTKSIRVGPLRKNEAAEADRIVRVAFGTYFGAPDPASFMGDRSFMVPRLRSRHVKVIAAREGGRLIGTNVITRWGSFGFFGPLTVLPEYWDRGVAQRLLEATMPVFDKWGVRHTGLFTFAASVKHVGLYQKFGYWPRYLTAVMTRTPEANSTMQPAAQPVLLSALSKAERERTIEGCAKITHQIDRGLDLSDEMREVLAQRTGDVVLTSGRGGAPSAFAICQHGPGSEGGAKTCAVKFGAARGGAGAGERFEKLLDACDVFAAARGLTIEAGVNLAREDAFQRMRAHGYRVTMQGVAMQRPHGEGFNRADVWVIDDWR
jgi:GNAT superfamily N-acetyltransferase